ncbi:MAG: hypothetical protein EOP49_47195 [Sphingobacteriales bacterium]|nr:MAG: hypothetical protein EOP49_47195 [Sphingobacteriales bacterium]
MYAGAMKKVHETFPHSADAAALYADALMVQHPWDLYDRLYKPKPWTPEIVRVLEQLVRQFPLHPGASHYYIHAIEGSEHPEKGLAVAKRLGNMMPGLAHLVHMPSHIYIRSGYYAEGIESNENAVKGYYQYLSQYPPVDDFTEVVVGFTIADAEITNYSTLFNLHKGAEKHVLQIPEDTSLLPIRGGQSQHREWSRKESHLDAWVISRNGDLFL